MQVPPRCAFSIRATVQPWSASFCESGLPACPEPITIASYFISADSFSSEPLAQVIGRAQCTGHGRQRTRLGGQFDHPAHRASAPLLERCGSQEDLECSLGFVSVFIND